MREIRQMLLLSHFIYLEVGGTLLKKKDLVVHCKKLTPSKADLTHAEIINHMNSVMNY